MSSPLLVASGDVSPVPSEAEALAWAELLFSEAAAATSLLARLGKEGGRTTYLLQPCPLAGLLSGFGSEASSV